MCYFRLTISASYRQAVAGHLKTAQPLGHVRQGKSLLTILAVLDGQSLAQGALVLRGHEQTVATWGHVFGCDGLQGAPRTKPSGRPPQRTPTPKATRATLLAAGPVQAGCSGAGWRSPRMPQWIDDRCGVFDHGFSMAQLLKH